MKRETIENILIIILLGVYITALILIPMIDQNSQWFIVTSGSMEPTLRVGDMVYVSKVDAEDIKAGDIITYQIGEENNRVTHRCIEVYDDGYSIFFKTKGDANDQEDQYFVFEEDLIGKISTYNLLGNSYNLKIPRIGYLSYFIHTFPGFFLFIILPGIAIIGLEGFNIVSTFKGEQELKNEHEKIFNKAKKMLTMSRRTTINVDHLKDMVKEINELAKNKEYEEAIKKSNQVIEKSREVIRIYKELQNGISILREMERNDIDYKHSLWMLRISKNRADRMDYDMAIESLYLANRLMKKTTNSFEKDDQPLMNEK